MIVAASLLQLLILVGALYDTARLLRPATGSRRAGRPSRSRAALEATERRLVDQRLRGRIDAGAYREGMRLVAEGREAPARRGHG